MNRFLARVAPAFLILSVLVVAPATHGESSAAEDDERILRDAGLRKLLKDPSAKVRLRAALALAKANDAEAIPVLIDLLTDLSADERQSVEDLLKELAGEWAPILQFARDDELSRSVRRDAWASWWRRSDAAMLLAAMAKHTLTADKRRRLQELLPQLGSDDFSVREAASRKLLAFGRLALPRLREAVTDRDLEAARRAKMLIEGIERGPDVRLPLAALRLLAVRKPSGAVEALLAYLPFAEDEVREEEVRKSLVVLARRDGKLDAALRRGLADAQPKVRAVAAEALIEGGGSEGRAAVRKLLKEDGPSVRLRVALALARAGEREGVSVLIDLMPLLSAEVCGQAEEALHRLAGDTAPQMPEGAAADDKKKRRDVWAAWWKVNAARVDIKRVNVRRLLGYTLICDQNRVFEVDRHGKERWVIAKAESPTDAWRLSNGHVLIAHWSGWVSERDPKGTVLWKQTGLSSVSNVQRLTNGHTLIALNNKAILELDRAGKEVHRINFPGLRAAYCFRPGRIVYVTSNNNECGFVDATGKVLSKFTVKYLIVGAGCLDVRPDGRLFLASAQAGKVMEYNESGKLLHEWNAPGVTTATGLPNGHILVAMQGNNKVVELD
ncbi:MAG: HEAT repeat domain-containing protein, partial [Gemmataceae bacterium]